MKTVRMVGWLVLTGALCGCDRPRQSECAVQYHVTGTAHGAVMEYRLPKGRMEQRTVTIPFTSDKYWFPIPSRVDAYVKARNTGTSGDLRVEILVDGQPDYGLAFRPSDQYTTNAYGIVRANCIVGAQ